MRICFVSRRFFPAISGMSVYALNLLRELVAAGHDVTMVSQYRGDAPARASTAAGRRRRSRACASSALRAARRTDGGDFERDVDDMVETILRRTRAARRSTCCTRSTAIPTGWAVLLAARRTRRAERRLHPGRRRALGRVVLRDAPAGDAARAGPRRRGADRLPELRRRGGGAARHDPARFTIVPGAVDARASARPRRVPGRRRSRCCSTMAASTGGKACSTCWTRWRCCATRASRSAARSRASARTSTRPRARTRSSGSTRRVHGLCRLRRRAGASIARPTCSSRPTYAEGFSNTILEAMASGLPCVSCRAVGVVDCLRDGENGLLVEPGDVPGAGRRAAACHRRTRAAPAARRQRGAGGVPRASIPGRRSAGRSWTSMRELAGQRAGHRLRRRRCRSTPLPVPREPHLL